MSSIVALVLALLVSRAQAQASAPMPDNPLRALLPSAEERREAHARELSASLERALRALPKVETAHVTLVLPDGSTVALDEPLPSPRASVLLHVRGEGPRDEQIERVARAIEPSLSLHVERMQAQSAHPQLGATRVFETTTASPALRWILASSLLANVLLATVLLARARKRPQRTLSTEQKSSATGRHR